MALTLSINLKFDLIISFYSLQKVVEKEKLLVGSTRPAQVVKYSIILSNTFRF